MSKRVFIIHGWEGSPEGNWFPWLKKELENKGFVVSAPAMPNTNKPTLQEWLTCLKRVVGMPDENTYLVGHSLGVIAILRYLEQLPKNQKIGGAIFVAGFPEPIGYEELNSFFITPLDYNKVKNSVKKTVAIHSDNDPYVPFRNGELLRDRLGAKLIVVSKAGHLNKKDGFTTLPIALNSILEMNNK